VVYDRLLEMVRFCYGEESSLLVGVYGVGAFLVRDYVAKSGSEGLIINDDIDKNNDDNDNNNDNSKNDIQSKITRTKLR
jgi:hypothetical protein